MSKKYPHYEWKSLTKIGIFKKNGIEKLINHGIPKNRLEIPI